MANKGTFLSDSVEQLAEFGKSTAKTTVKSVVDTLNPLKILESSSGKTDSVDEQRNLSAGRQETSEVNKGKNATSLNFDKLQNKYKDQDKLKQDALRNRLFQLVKGGEERVMETKKREEEEKKRKEVYEIQEKKRKEQQKKQQEQNADIPHGKARKSIFSHKKVAQREQVEVKANSGKQ